MIGRFGFLRLKRSLSYWRAGTTPVMVRALPWSFPPSSIRFHGLTIPAASTGDWARPGRPGSRSPVLLPAGQSSFTAPLGKGSIGRTFDVGSPVNGIGHTTMQTPPTSTFCRPASAKRRAMLVSGGANATPTTCPVTARIQLNGNTARRIVARANAAVRSMSSLRGRSDDRRRRP